MKTYLVGGAVRDELLGFPIQERDWVVVGTTPQQMLDRGYQQVGKDFPVFLHPASKEEYALARTERKQGVGYTGFSVFADPSVTLEEDLQRRDLTINAIAKSEAGDIIDPFDGQGDMQRRYLRHVSPAFVEDPLRVLRVARFAARFAHLDFTVAPETMSLMASIVEAKELQTLSPERVWRETEKALATSSPAVYFSVLRECGALEVLLPELAALFGVPQSPQSHPEIDAGQHSLMVLTQAASLTEDTAIRYAALMHDLGKALTPLENLPRHPGHDAKTLPLLAQIQARLRVPNRHAQLAVLVAQWHTTLHAITDQSADTVLEMLTATGAFRQGGLTSSFIVCCLADCRGRAGFEDAEYPQADLLSAVAEKCAAVSANALAAEGLQGKAIGDAVAQQRLEIIDASLLEARKR
jgi:tRNA nucleotidyltransferase (CCA-adding enzyme)